MPVLQVGANNGTDRDSTLALAVIGYEPAELCGVDIVGLLASPLAERETPSYQDIKQQWTPQSLFVVNVGYRQRWGSRQAIYQAHDRLRHRVHHRAVLTTVNSQSRVQV
jgi:hypothetical protein